MQRVELKGISNLVGVVDSAIMNRNEITSELKKVNGYPFIYVLAVGDEVVYIGYSSSLCERLRQHKTNKDFDKIVIIEMENRKVARLTERSLIKEYKPKHNYQYIKYKA